jgi:hypothetical protein
LRAAAERVIVPQAGMSETDRWSREAFLQKACSLMVAEVDWDSLDSGRLHHATSAARDLAGVPVIVGVLDDPSMLFAVLDDAATERRDSGHPNAALWLYVPQDMTVPPSSSDKLMIHRVPGGPAESSR